MSLMSGNPACCGCNHRQRSNKYFRLSINYCHNIWMTNLTYKDAITLSNFFWQLVILAVFARKLLQTVVRTLSYTYFEQFSIENCKNDKWSVKIAQCDSTLKEAKTLGFAKSPPSSEVVPPVIIINFAIYRRYFCMIHSC